MVGTLPVRIELVRARRKTLALRVRDGEVRVSAPLTASTGRIEAFVHSHAEWIDRELARSRASLAACRTELTDGRALKVLGRPVRISLDRRARRHRWADAVDGTEVLVLPAESAERAVERALRARALAWFVGRVEEYCLRLGVPSPRVALGSARTRWGSCSLKSGIRLHWKLVLLAPELAEYVVAHEVAHLREMNHSPRFWALVDGLCPQWREYRRRLRLEGASLPEFVPASRPPDLLGDTP